MIHSVVNSVENPDGLSLIPDPIIKITTKGDRGKNFQLVNGTGTGPWDRFLF
jgi:hypothetical protein